MNHRDAWDLIPWLVNGSINSAQREQLETHLTGCTQCCDEARAQRALLQAMRTVPQVEAMPHASMQKLWARLDADASPGIPCAAPLIAGQRQPVRAWLVASSACAALLLGGTLLVAIGQQHGRRAAEFRTVSDATMVPRVAGIRAVFSDQMTLQELRTLLEGTGLRIAAGPSSSGVYTLTPASATDDPHAALTALRAHPSVRFAEPTGQ